HELDGVLYGDDVILADFVCVVHDRGQGRGLAASGWSGNQDQPFVQLRKFLHDWRQPQLIDSQECRWNQAENSADTVLLIEEICAEPRNVRNFVPEIDVAGFFKSFHFLFWRDFVEYFFEIIAIERGVIDAFHLATDTDNGLG